MSRESNPFMEGMTWLWRKIDGGFVAAILAVLFFSILTILDAHGMGWGPWSDLVQGSGKNVADESLRNLHDGVLIILTMVLILVAWTQLRGMRKNSHQEFLMRIMEHFGAPEMIKARIIIRKLQIGEKNKNGWMKMKSNDEVANDILELSQASKEEDVGNFVCLNNFLDFLEAIAYLANKGSISENELRDFMELSMEFYYHIFSRWIAKRQMEDKYFYCEIKKFARGGCI